MFKGNVDKSGVVINALPIMQRAQFVRFYPTASHLWPCLRVEIFVEIGKISRAIFWSRARVHVRNTNFDE